MLSRCQRLLAALERVHVATQDEIGEAAEGQAVDHGDVVARGPSQFERVLRGRQAGRGSNIHWTEATCPRPRATATSSPISRPSAAVASPNRSVLAGSE